MSVYIYEQIISTKGTVIFKAIVKLFTCPLPSGGVAYVVTPMELIKLIQQWHVRSINVILNVASMTTFSFSKDSTFYLIQFENECKLKKCLSTA